MLAELTRYAKSSYATWVLTLEAEAKATIERVFAALADSIRRDILIALAFGGPATVTKLADQVSSTPQTVAKRLALLVKADLVAIRLSPPPAQYRLHSAPMRVAQQLLAEMVDSKAARLAAYRVNARELLVKLADRGQLELRLLRHSATGAVHVVLPHNPDAEQRRDESWLVELVTLARTPIPTLCGYRGHSAARSGTSAIDQLVTTAAEGRLCPACRVVLSPVSEHLAWTWEN
jgi:DNA-binding transcriptional ArsR family regulator